MDAAQNGSKDLLLAVRSELRAWGSSGLFPRSMAFPWVGRSSLRLGKFGRSTSSCMKMIFDSFWFAVMKGEFPIV